MSDGDSPKLATRPFLFEVVEWSEQLRSVISVWLGAVGRSVQVRLCTSGCMSEKMFGVIIIIIIIIITIIIIEGNKSGGGDKTPNIFSLIHPLVQSRS